jgi:BirA family biotin operon repressor/biotin-[acetyl-CoA-carboxylase] ligase
VLVFDQVDSTNSVAAALADNPKHRGVVVLAREQSAGRGQHGRQWECPAGAGVLLSALLFPPPALRRPALLTAWAAVSVCETILHITGLQARIKWPNDVLIKGRKVCGILIEQSRGTVVGIGLNLNQPAKAFAAAGLTAAGSLSLFTGNKLDLETVARQLILQLDEQYDNLCQGDVHTLEACWKWRIGLLGKQVQAECVDGAYQGRLLELSFAGLEIATADGTSVQVLPEAVKHLFPS